MYQPKKYSLKEFVVRAKADLDAFEKDWSGDDSNEFHRGEHTWAEWWRSFGGYFSWEER